MTLSFSVMIFCVGPKKKKKSISFQAHSFAREKRKEAFENLDILWDWDGRSSWPSRGDKQAKCQHPLITPAKLLPQLCLTWEFWLYTSVPLLKKSPMCCQPFATPLFAESASKVQTTQLPPTGIDSTSDAGGCWDPKTFASRCGGGTGGREEPRNSPSSGWIQGKHRSHAAMAYRPCAGSIPASLRLAGQNWTKLASSCSWFLQARS